MHEQIIYFGPPGTGKSYYVNEKIKSAGKGKVFRVTIHPEFTYSDFVGQLLPTENPATGSIEFPFHAGPFTRALAEAYSDTSKEVYLVLEELSRGNVAAIFGDLFQLLDRNEYFVSRYPVRNKNIADMIVELISDEVTLPANFNIIGTVNMNDQNVFPMDTAFKRRFDWEYVSTKPVCDSSGNRKSQLNNPKLFIATDNVRANDLTTTWQSFYVALNAFITDKEKGLGKSEDKQVGQFFIDFGEILTSDSHSADPFISGNAAEKINTVIKNKLLLYLWQDVQGVSSFGSVTRLFDKDIKSFDDLFSSCGKEKTFSDSFIENFLKPKLNLYPY